MEGFRRQVPELRVWNAGLGSLYGLGLRQVDEHQDPAASTMQPSPQYSAGSEQMTWISVGVILGLYWENGKHNGNYYDYRGLYRGYIWIM